MAYLTLLNVLNEVNKWRVKYNLKIEVPSKSLKTKQALLNECSIENANTKCKESTLYSDILNKAIGSMNSI